MGKMYLLCELVGFTLKGIWVAPTLFSRVPTGTEGSISPPGLLTTRAGQEEIWLIRVSRILTGKLMFAKLIPGEPCRSLSDMPEEVCQFGVYLNTWFHF